MPGAKTGFLYEKPQYIVRSHWSQGKWSTPDVTTSDRMDISLAATVFHYGQSAFEGLKAFRNPQGKVGIFRPDENARRLQLSCERLCMPKVEEKMFIDAVELAVKQNQSVVPEFDSNGSLYIRPFIFGSAPTIGVRPSDEYEFAVLVMPVGEYYSPGSERKVKAAIANDFDRAAPLGMGNVKAAGNYAADLRPTKIAKDEGYDLVLFLDAKTRTKIEEFGTSNFVALDKDGKYITPESNTILASVTNKSLLQLCQHLGVPAERREVLRSELDQFVEIGACGTAVGITNIDEIYQSSEKLWTRPERGESKLENLLKELRSIQKGLVKDPFGWRLEIN